MRLVGGRMSTPLDDGKTMPERSILARIMAHSMYGWTDEEFCDDEDPQSDHDRLDFLQMADIALRYFESREQAKADS